AGPAALTQPFVEVGAVAHRLDLQIARMEVAVLAKSLDLTTATRFVTLLDVAGIDRRTRDPEGRCSASAASMCNFTFQSRTAARLACVSRTRYTPPRSTASRRRPSTCGGGARCVSVVPLDLRHRRAVSA